VIETTIIDYRNVKKRSRMGSSPFVIIHCIEEETCSIQGKGRKERLYRRSGSPQWYQASGREGRTHENVSRGGGKHGGSTRRSHVFVKTLEKEGVGGKKK